MSKTIRIGTRDSELALWQAHTVQKKLNDLGYQTEIVAVKSQGDILLDKPLYELGITGIFTKTLDIAMLNGQVDIAVHSMKDVPTALPIGIVQAAVLERANTLDILVHKGNLEFLNSTGTIATGSLRRQAQWLNKYPNHTVVDLRGNVNTRMQKLHDSDWNGAVFAAAGLERINLKPEFLKTLEGGCTAPIGALATFTSDKIDFEGVLFSLDGKEKHTIKKSCTFDSYKNFGKKCAEEILNNGGSALMESIRRDLKK
jgi:hydroxymethylbilane synthase